MTVLVKPAENYQTRPNRSGVVREKNMAIGPTGAKTKNDWTDGGQQQITRLYQTGAVEHGIIGESPSYWRLLLINKYLKIQQAKKHWKVLLLF
jgi:hypothetical protein